MLKKMGRKETFALKKRLLEKVVSLNSLLIACYLALVGVLLFLLFRARTPIPTVIWDTFGPSNLVVYLAMTFLLLVIIMYKGKTSTKISLIIVQSIVTHIFMPIISESRYGYDTWISLGYSTSVFREDFSPNIVPFTVYGATGSSIQKIYSITERVNLYSFSVLLARMFSVDVEWTHLLIVPLLWGIFIPVLTYRISNFFYKRESVLLLTTLISSSTLGVGAGTISFNLASLFYLVVIYLSLKYWSSPKSLFLAFAIVFATFITHELVGVLSLSVILLAAIYQQTRDLTHKNIQRILLLGAFVSLVLLLPVSLTALRFVLGVGPTFSLKPLEGLPAYEAIFLFVFGKYAEMKFIDAFVSALTLLALIGLIYTIIEIDRSPNPKPSVFMFVCLALVMIDYTIIKLFMTNVPWGPENMWTFRDMLLIPFAAIVIIKAMNYLSSRIASERSVKLPGNPHFGKFASRGIFSIKKRKIAVAGIFILSLSSFLTVVAYNAYPHSTYMRAWTTAHEIEAARYIEETTPRNETYIVLTEASTRLAGYPVVGPQNPRAYWYGPYESRVLQTLYFEFIKNPSLGPLFEVRQKNKASIVYVVVTKFRPPVDGNSQVIEQLMDQPYLELYAVFGEGVYIPAKLEATVYVFKARLPSERIISRIGASIYEHNSQVYVNTTFTVDVVTYEANYTVTLTGSPVYNITGWPTHWSFESIVPAPFTKSVDADKWIYFTGSEDEAYTITWTANILYQPAGWKDDSFKEGWRVPLHYGTLNWQQPPQISMDGDVVSMTGVFRKGVREKLLLEREVSNISTSDYPYVIVRWRSTSTCAWAAVVYEDENGELGITYILKPTVGYAWAQYSGDWKITALKLPEGKIIKALRIALDDYPPWTDIEGTNSAYYDFIMLSKISKPQF